MIHKWIFLVQESFFILCINNNIIINNFAFRLTGYSPFFGDDYSEILDKNKKCKICFDF